MQSHAVHVLATMIAMLLMIEGVVFFISWLNNFIAV